jgi:hypothetical protein
MRDIGDRQQGDLGAIEGAPSRRCAGLGSAATGLRLLVMGAGGLLQQLGDLARFHDTLPSASTVDAVRDCKRCAIAKRLI